MKYSKLIANFLCIFLIFLAPFGLKAQINSIIVVKVGDLLVTSVDVQNEIITNLLLNNIEITQENINNGKSYAVKNLINKRIKKIEVNKYQEKSYNKKDLRKYTDNIAKKFNTDAVGLKKIFKNNNVSYDIFIDNRQIELIWNTLIAFKTKQPSSK